jgi:hypothetical protein
VSWIRRNRLLVLRVRELIKIDFGTNENIAAVIRQEFKTGCSVKTVQRIRNEKNSENRTVSGQFPDSLPAR